MIDQNALALLLDERKEARTQLGIWKEKAKLAREAIKYWEEREEKFDNAIACVSFEHPAGMVAANEENREASN